MALGLLTLYLHIPGCSSLKEKRKRIKPLVARLQKEFNLSIAEVDQLDVWQSCTLGCAFISNDHKHVQRYLEKVVDWLEINWHDVELMEERIELF